MTTELTAAALAALADVRRTPAQVLRHPPLRRRYKVALALASAGMVLVPLAYAALVLGVVAVVLSQAMASWRLAASLDGWGAIGCGLVSLTGSVLVAFLLKPALRRDQRRKAALVVTREEQPVLTELVERTCALVGAPRPVRIEVDCQVNAAASLERSWRKPWGDGLVLTVGLPLAAGMSLNQLTGVIAHEAGHFAQGTGMQLSSTVRGVSFWLAEVVHRRDRWDHRLESWSETYFPISAGLLVLRVLLGVSRLLLRAFLGLGLLVSSALTRAMELDADAREAQVVGTETSASTFRRLAELSSGMTAAVARLNETWPRGRLVDDLVELTVRESELLPDDVTLALDRTQAEGKTGTWDSHPCDRERIASLREDPEAGVFTSSAASRDAFLAFDELSRRATLAQYEAMLGQEFRKAELVSTALAVHGHEGGHSEADAYARFFAPSGDATGAPRLGLPAVVASTRPGDSFARLRAARERLAQRSGENAVDGGRELADLMRDRIGAAVELLGHAEVRRRLASAETRRTRTEEVLATLAALEGAALAEAATGDDARVRALLGELALTCEQVETAMGLPILAWRHVQSEPDASETHD